MSSLIEAATSVAKKIQNAGFQVFFVGGFVRDLIMGNSIKDIDIVTNANPDDLIPILNIAHTVGKQFSVVATIENGHMFEISSFRCDGIYKDYRKPSLIKKGTIDQDSKRRDFTINGLYFEPFSNAIIDLVGGKSDINSKTLRAIGNPKERIYEDRLRIMRGVRFVSAFQLSFDKETKNAMHATEIRPWVSNERIKDEIYKLDKLNALFESFKLFKSLKLLKNLFPDQKPYINKSVESLIKFNDFNLCTILKLVAIFPNMDLSTMKRLLPLTKIELSKIEIFHKTVLAIESNENELEFILNFNKLWYKSPAKLAIWHCSKKNKRAAKKYSCFLENNKENISQIINKQGPITGKILSEKGISSGPIYRELINRAWSERVLNKKSDEEIAVIINEMIVKYNN